MFEIVTDINYYNQHTVHWKGDPERISVRFEWRKDAEEFMAKLEWIQTLRWGQ